VHPEALKYTRLGINPMDISNLTSLRHLSTVNTFKFLAPDRSGI
jgi:hypothetical protein